MFQGESDDDSLCEFEIPDSSSAHDNDCVSDSDAGSDAASDVSGDLICIDNQAAIQLRRVNAMQASRRISNFVDAAIVENELHSALRHELALAVYARHAAERGLRVVSALQEFWNHWCPDAARLVSDTISESCARTQFWDAYYVDLPEETDDLSPPPCSCWDVTNQEVESARSEAAQAAAVSASRASPWANMVVIMQRLDAFLTAQEVLKRAKITKNDLHGKLHARLATLEVQESELLARSYLYPEIGNEEAIRTAMCAVDDDLSPQNSQRQSGDNVFLNGSIADLAAIADDNDRAIYLKRLRGNWRTLANLRQYLYPEMQERFVKACALRRNKEKSADAAAENAYAAFNETQDKPPATPVAPKVRADTDAAMEQMCVFVADAWHDFAMRDFARVAEQIPMEPAIPDGRCADFYRNVTFLCLPGPASAAVTDQCRTFFKKRQCLLLRPGHDMGGMSDALNVSPNQCISMLREAHILWNSLAPSSRRCNVFVAVDALSAHETITISRAQRAREQCARTDFVQQFRVAVELARKRRETVRLQRPLIAYSAPEENSDDDLPDYNKTKTDAEVKADEVRQEAKETARIVSWFINRTVIADTIVDFCAAQLASQVSQSLEYALCELRNLRTRSGWWESAQACGLLPKRATDCATWTMCTLGFEQQESAIRGALQNSSYVGIFLVAFILAAILQRMITHAV